MSSYDSLNVAPYLLTSLGFIRNIEFCILNKYCHRKARKGNLILQLIFASSVYCFYDFSFLVWNVLCPDFNVSCLVRNSRLAVTQLSRIIVFLTFLSFYPLKAVAQTAESSYFLKVLARDRFLNFTRCLILAAAPLSFH